MSCNKQHPCAAQVRSPRSKEISGAMKLTPVIASIELQKASCSGIELVCLQSQLFRFPTTNTAYHQIECYDTGFFTSNPVHFAGCRLETMLADDCVHKITA